MIDVDVYTGDRLCGIGNVKLKQGLPTIIWPFDGTYNMW